MASITSLKASDGSGNASVATVQSVRSPLATTLVVDTVQGINSSFHATMGTPHTFVDPVTSETITVISEASAVDFQGHVDGGNLEIDTIAPGFTDAGSAVNDIVIIKPTTQWADQVASVLAVSHDDDGTLKAGAVDNAAVLASNVVETPKIKDGAVTNPKLDITSSTDANGWKVTTLGTTKYYRKRVTFSQTIGGLAVLIISSSVLPVGVSTIGTRTLVYSPVISGSAGVILINFEGTSAHTFLNFTTATTEGSSRTVTGFIDVMLIED